MPGPAVVVVPSGGFPVNPVDSGAPVLSAVESGGLAITLTDNGSPFVVEGLWVALPIWQAGIFVAGNNAFGWGFAKPPIVSAPLGTLVDEPYTGSELLSFWEAPDDSQVIVTFLGDVVDQLDGYTFSVNGTPLSVLTEATYDPVNNWTIMFLEPHWMIDGQAYVIARVPAVAPFEADYYIADGGTGDGFTQGTS